MSNTGGTRVPSGYNSTGGLGLGGSARQESAAGGTAPTTRGWKKRGLAAYRRVKKQKKLAGLPSSRGSTSTSPAAAAPVKAPAKPKPDWLGTLDEKTVDQIVGKTAYQKYHPAFQEIASQKRISDAQQKRLGDWYGQYQAAIGQAAKGTAEAYGGAVGLVTGAGQQMAAQDETNRQALAQQQMADAQARGVTYSPANDVTAQQASGSRLAANNSYAGLLAAQGAADTTRLQQQAGVVVPGQLMQARTDEAARKRALEGKATDLLKEKGDYKVTLKDQKRENERKHQLELAAFNLKGSQAQQDYAVALAKYKAQQAKDKKALEKDAYQRKYGLGPYKPAASKGSGSGGGSKGSGGSKATKPAKPSEAYRKGVRLVQGGYGVYFRDLNSGLSMTQIATKLRSAGYSEVAIKAAADLATKGRVTGPTAREFLDAYGTPLPIVYRTTGKYKPARRGSNVLKTIPGL